MNWIKNTDKVAKELTEFCQKVIVSATNSAPPVLLVVIAALAGSILEPDKGKGFWLNQN